MLAQARAAFNAAFCRAPRAPRQRTPGGVWWVHDVAFRVRTDAVRRRRLSSRVRSPVGHIDIGPTILNALRVERAPPEFLGTSRLGVIAGTVPDDLGGQVFQEVTYEGPGSPMRGTQKRAVVTHDWHYIRNVVPEATAELFARSEPEDRAPDHAGEGLPDEERLASLLAAWMDQLAVFERKR